MLTADAPFGDPITSVAGLCREQTYGKLFSMVSASIGVFIRIKVVQSTRPKWTAHTRRRFRLRYMTQSAPDLSEPDVIIRKE